MDWKDINVIVTGGAGFIGSHLSERLANAGAKVCIVDNLERGQRHHITKFDNIFINHNLADEFKHSPDLIEAFRLADYVFHLAYKVGGIPYTGGRQYFSEIWRDGSRINTNTLAHCAKAQVPKVIFASSACVYPNFIQAKVGASPITEDQVFPACPDDAYGWGKLMGELYLQWLHENTGLKGAILRFFNVYGEREFLDREIGHCLPVFCRKALEYPQKPFDIHGKGEETRCFTYVSDVVDACILAAEKVDIPTAFNIGTPESITISALAKKIIAISGKNIKITYDTNYSGATGVKSRTPDITKAKAILGWEPKVSLEEGLARTYAWVKSFLGL